MIDLTASEFIERPVDEVFDFVADLESLPQWLEGCKKAWALSDDPTAVGARVAHLDEFMGKQFEAHFEVVEWVPNEKRVFQAISGPFRGTSAESFYDEDGATRIETRITGDPVGPLGLGSWLVGRTIKGQLERSLANLKRVMEA
ncbi:MAG: SRPBCC family protein [Actinomycetota bacterium]